MYIYICKFIIYIVISSLYSIIILFYVLNIYPLMKKLLLLVATATALFSCNSNTHTIILSNGAKVEATNTSRTIEYGRGSTVCIVKTNTSRWIICSDGEMKDTTYVRSYNEDGKHKVYTVTHKIGKISSY